MWQWTFPNTQAILGSVQSFNVVGYAYTVDYDSSIPRGGMIGVLLGAVNEEFKSDFTTNPPPTLSLFLYTYMYDNTARLINSA